MTTTHTEARTDAQRGNVAKLVKPEGYIKTDKPSASSSSRSKDRHYTAYYKTASTEKVRFTGFVSKSDTEALGWIIKKACVNKVDEFITLSLMEKLPTGKDDYRPVYYREHGERQSIDCVGNADDKPNTPKPTKKERILAKKKEKSSWFKTTFLGTDVKERLIVKRVKVLLDKGTNKENST